MNKNLFFRKPFEYKFFNASLWIIAINVFVFILTSLYPQLKTYLSLNVVLIVRHKMYWQFLTYMFTHANISHLIFNMFGILFFGVNLEKAIGSKEFVLFYLVCGVLCGVLSFTGYYFTGGYRIFLLGASGAVYAILFAYAVVFPRSIIYIWGLLPIPAPILVLIYTVIEIFSQVFSSSNVAHLTHLFGFLIAWIYFVVRMGIHPIKIWKGKY